MYNHPEINTVMSKIVSQMIILILKHNVEASF